MTRNYYLLLSAYALSAVGNWIYKLALPLLIYERTHSALGMALAFGVTYLPFLLFSPFGGVLADRHDRRRLLWAGDTVSGVVAASLAFAVLVKPDGLWLLYPLVFLLASVEPFYHAAFQSILPSLVAPDRLARANAGLQGADNLTAFVGPLLGGGVIAAVGTLPALYVNAGSFLLSAVLIGLIRGTERSRAGEARPRRDVLEELKEGLSHVLRSPILRYGSLLFVGANFALSLFTANFMYYLASTLGLGAAQIGLVTSASGAGAIAGAVAAPRLGRGLSPGVILVAGTILEGLSITMLLPVRGPIAAALVLGAMMFFETLLVVTWFTLRQRTVPEHLLGRVVATTRLIAFCPIPIASVVAGLILRVSGSTAPVIAASGLLTMLVGVAAWRSPICASTRVSAPFVPTDTKH
ncbi:MFS transporter [Sorangium sp. So ce362]|uniref:MFS transporter n=1 Tax=Sorangium sp. So ce362 TaxID=3133303 RepID=UPI003F63342B